MKNAVKIILSLCLVIVFIMACFLVFAGITIGGWLHTYRTFTQKELVAVIEVDGMEIDDNGLEYSTIVYKPVKDQSALTRVFSSKESDKVEYEEPEKYKIYGDQVEIGGEFVKFNDFFNLFGIRNIYKVTRLEGDFSDPEIAANLEKGERTVYALNGGTDDYWKYMQENSSRVDFFVDSVYGSYSSKFVTDEKVQYGLYVTEDGFLLDEMD